MSLTEHNTQQRPCGDVKNSNQSSTLNELNTLNVRIRVTRNWQDQVGGFLHGIMKLEDVHGKPAYSVWLPDAPGPITANDFETLAQGNSKKWRETIMVDPVASASHGPAAEAPAAFYRVVKNASSLVSGTVMWNYLRPRQQIADGSVKKVHHQSDQPANRSELLGCWVAVKMTPYDSCYSYGQCVFVDAQGDNAEVVLLESCLKRVAINLNETSTWLRLSKERSNVKLGEHAQILPLLTRQPGDPNLRLDPATGRRGINLGKAEWAEVDGSVAFLGDPDCMTKFLEIRCKLESRHGFGKVDGAMACILSITKHLRSTNHPKNTSPYYNITIQSHSKVLKLSSVVKAVVLLDSMLLSGEKFAVPFVSQQHYQASVAEQSVASGQVSGCSPGSDEEEGEEDESETQEPDGQGDKQSPRLSPSEQATPSVAAAQRPVTVAGLQPVGASQDAGGTFTQQPQLQQRGMDMTLVPHQAPEPQGLLQTLADAAATNAALEGGAGTLTAAASQPAAPTNQPTPASNLGLDQALQSLMQEAPGLGVWEVKQGSSQERSLVQSQGQSQNIMPCSSSPWTTVGGFEANSGEPTPSPQLVESAAWCPETGEFVGDAVCCDKFHRLEAEFVAELTPLGSPEAVDPAAISALRARVKTFLQSHLVSISRARRRAGRRKDLWDYKFSVVGLNSKAIKYKAIPESVRALLDAYVQWHAAHPWGYAWQPAQYRNAAAVLPARRVANRPISVVPQQPKLGLNQGWGPQHMSAGGQQAGGESGDEGVFGIGSGDRDDEVQVVQVVEVGGKEGARTDGGQGQQLMPPPPPQHKTQQAGSAQGAPLQQQPHSPTHHAVQDSAGNLLQQVVESIRLSLSQQAAEMAQLPMEPSTEVPALNLTNTWHPPMGLSGIGGAGLAGVTAQPAASQAPSCWDTAIQLSTLLVGSFGVDSWADTHSAPSSNLRSYTDSTQAEGGQGLLMPGPTSTPLPRTGATQHVPAAAPGADMAAFQAWLLQQGLALKPGQHTFQNKSDIALIEAILLQLPVDQRVAITQCHSLCSSVGQPVSGLEMRPIEGFLAANATAPECIDMTSGLSKSLADLLASVQNCSPVGEGSALEQLRQTLSLHLHVNVVIDCFSPFDEGYHRRVGQPVGSIAGARAVHLRLGHVPRTVSDVVTKGGDCATWTQVVACGACEQHQGGTARPAPLCTEQQPQRADRVVAEDHTQGGGVGVLQLVQCPEYLRKLPLQPRPLDAAMVFDDDSRLAQLHARHAAINRKSFRSIWFSRAPSPESDEPSQVTADPPQCEAGKPSVVEQGKEGRQSEPAQQGGVKRKGGVDYEALRDKSQAKAAAAQARLVEARQALADIQAKAVKRQQVQQQLAAERDKMDDPECADEGEAALEDYHSLFVLDGDEERAAVVSRVLAYVRELRTLTPPDRLVAEEVSAREAIEHAEKEAKLAAGALRAAEAAIQRRKRVQADGSLPPVGAVP